MLISIILLVSAVSVLVFGTRKVVTSHYVDNYAKDTGDAQPVTHQRSVYTEPVVRELSAAFKE